MCDERGKTQITPHSTPPLFDFLNQGLREPPSDNDVV